MRSPFARFAARAACSPVVPRKFVALAALAFATSTGCGEPASDPPSAAAGASEPVAPPAPVNPLGRERCRAPAGTSSSPRTVEASVALLNALPKPTTVACFVESLQRPLAVFVSNSQFSAQPALSNESPRVFIKIGELWLSVVVDGESSYLIEFGELTTESQPRSRKGELKLPLTAPIAPSAPFDRVRYGTGTVCGFCHGGERQEPDVAALGAFASEALRPRPETRVTLDALRRERALCSWQAEPHRCELLSAIFDGGLVTEVSFPESMATFF